MIWWRGYLRRIDLVSDKTTQSCLQVLLAQGLIIATRHVCVWACLSPMYPRHKQSFAGWMRLDASANNPSRKPQIEF